MNYFRYITILALTLSFLAGCSNRTPSSPTDLAEGQGNAVETAPAFLTYSQNPASYTLSAAIAENIPTNRGGAAATYTVSPPLPFGLSLNASTGVISGTPLVESPSVMYKVMASNSGGSTTAILNIAVTTPSQACENTGTTSATDEGYRVVIAPASGWEISIPAPSTSWQIQYKFTTPPLPCSTTWNYTNQVFYIWGDIDFDEYGAIGKFPMSNYTYNQITPQLSIGNSLSGNNAGYAPSGNLFKSWVIQAQYFWMRSDGTPFALTGPIINVSPGDVLTTTIAYDASSGAITASISAPEGTSSILLPAPFPNETTPPFSSWKSFFQQALTKSSSLIAKPNVNVESHFVDQQTLCSVLPFEIQSVALPNIADSGSNYSVSPYGSYTCPTSLAGLNF